MEVLNIFSQVQDENWGDRVNYENKDRKNRRIQIKKKWVNLYSKMLLDIDKNWN